MAWKIKDEWIDLAQGHHRVVFHNPDVLVPHPETGAQVPVEHHLVHHFKLKSCPTCGHARHNAEEEPIDFHQTKADVHRALHEHHNQIMRYRELHPNVRIGHGPKA
jgi:hypothetical protein